MSLDNVLNIAASGMTANRFWMDQIANNLANANTTRSAEGGPYRRKVPIFQELVNQQTGEVAGVEATGVAKDPSPLPRRYDPGNPDADAQGFVTMPNVNVVTEMVDMIAASKTYQADVTVASAAKTMESKALTIDG
ncbi:MAG TPA: flagellar basal body rod protein FlgC [Oscillatoriaceae cyanobacterium]